MSWIHTGGGYYENEETGERIRGKANIPDGEELTTEDTPTFVYQCVGNCYAETEHGIEKMDGYDLLTCLDCDATVARNL